MMYREIGKKELVQVGKQVSRMAYGGQRNKEYDELLSSGYLGLAEAGAAFDPTRGTPFPALVSIFVKGRVIDQIRRHKRWHGVQKPRLEPSPESVELLNTLPEDGIRRTAVLSDIPAPPRQRSFGLESRLCKKELVKQLRVALADLKPKEMAIVEGFYLEGANREELAKRFECCRRTINNTLRRSLKKLEKSLRGSTEEVLYLLG